MLRTIKSAIKSLAGSNVYHIVRMFYQPGEDRAGAWRFRGEFKVKSPANPEISLYNSGFRLESAIFWLGFDKFSWELLERRLWVELSKNADVIFDVGANTGIYSVLSKAHNANARVVAFEPQPNIFAALKRNCSANSFSIDCEQLAVADFEGSAPFFNYGENTFTDINTTAGSLNEDWRPDNQTSVEVAVIRLDKYLSEKDIQSLDLMKIDVETLEDKVLKGLGDSLKTTRPIVLLEIVTEEIGSNIDQLLRDLDYRYFTIDESKHTIEPVSVLGGSVNTNFVLCPSEKENGLKDAIEKVTK